MDYSNLVVLKNSNNNATAFYDGKEVFIRKTFDSSGLVEVIDLNDGDIFTIHCSKLNENNISFI